MTQLTTKDEAVHIEGVITMTSRDRSREDFISRIERMLLCLTEVDRRGDNGERPVLEPLGYEGNAFERTLRFRYRLVAATSALLSRSAMA
ncbi:MAG: hypothetical protein WCP31_08690 [Chloroflexales bacterium]